MLANTISLALLLAIAVSASTPSPVTPPPSDVGVDTNAPTQSAPAPTPTTACAPVLSSLMEDCGEWFEMRANTTNWGSFCTNDCLERLRDASDCLLADPEMKNGALALPVIDAVCRRDGPNRAYCGAVVFNRIDELSGCEDAETQNACATAVEGQCEWKDSRCHPSITTAVLDDVCSTCTRGIHSALALSGIATRDRAFSRYSGIINDLITFECIKHEDTYCKAALEENDFKTDDDFADLCSSTTKTACARKIMPIYVTKMRAEAIGNVLQCAAHLVQSGVDGENDYLDRVTTNCLPCYTSSIVQALQIQVTVANMCQRNSAGAYCAAMVRGGGDGSGSHGSGSGGSSSTSSSSNGGDTLGNCYRAMMNGTCDSLCNQLMAAAVGSFGCCSGLLSVWNGIAISENDELAFTTAVSEVYTLWSTDSEAFGSLVGGFGSDGSHGDHRRDDNETSWGSWGSGWGSWSYGSGWGSWSYGSGWGSWSYGSGWGSYGSYGSGWGSWSYGSGWGSWSYGSGWGSWSYGSGWGSWGSYGSNWGSWGSYGSGSWGSYGSHGSGNNNGCQHQGEGGIDLEVLSVCSSLTNVVEQAQDTTCTIALAAVKITKALKLKLNCTAVMASVAVMNAVEDSITNDIAAALGLSVSALLDRRFVCPLDSERRVAAGATYEFTIQTEDADLTTSAAAQLDQSLAEGTLRFPALASTVETVCTTCATAADLENFAEATEPTEDNTSSSFSAVTVLTAAVALLLTAVFM